MNYYSSYSAYDSATAGAGILAGLGVFLMIFSLIGTAISVITIIALWKIFKKAGKNGWEAIIPIYNMIVLVQIIEKPMYYIIFFFLPIAPIVNYIALAEKFGKSTGFGVLTFFFPFVCLPILAFGKDAYKNTAPMTMAGNVTETVAAPTEAPATNSTAASVIQQPTITPSQPAATEAPVETPASATPEAAPVATTETNNITTQQAAAPTGAPVMPETPTNTEAPAVATTEPIMASQPTVMPVSGQPAATSVEQLVTPVATENSTTPTNPIQPAQ